MALPANDTAWPPVGSKAAAKLYEEWGAWYSGDPDDLHRVYRVTNGLGAVIDPKTGSATAGASGLAINQAARFFWGNPPDGGEVRHTKVHVPLAADIATTSADLLYGEPPSIGVVDDEATNAAIEDLLEGGLVTALLEQAELGSALGGAYVRVAWDPAVSDRPIFDVIPPDSAAPEWRSGVLRAVNFWRNVREESGTVWRHVERHEPGYVYHGLYKGSTDSLGTRVNLLEHPETAAFARLVDGESGRVATGSRELTAQYFPNVRPNRLLRGSPLGRSDYSGVESTFDALDETWSSLMRDIQLGKGRMIVPESYLESQGAGKGAKFNAEKRYFTPVKALPGDDGIDIRSIQFDIRVDEHLSAARALASQGIRGAGYSAQTFGDHETGAAATATEIQAREKRSYTTRSRKTEYQKPPLRRLVRAGLDLYVSKFNRTDIKPQLPDVVFPDGVQTDELTVAKTIQMLDAAKAASTRTKVELAHPQWDKERIEEEIEAIEGAETDPVEDPGDLPEGDMIGPEGPEPPEEV